MPETSLPVRHLFKIVIETDAPSLIPGAPQGDRMLVGIKGGRFEGADLSGTVIPPGGDWVTQRADGSIKLDVKMTLQTNDDALIYVSYFGIGVIEEGTLSVRSAPLFETGDERYAWLNNLQGIGIGGLEDGHVVYDVYALL